MTSIDGPDTLLGEWARVIAASLADSGVREVVVSPGSRSTPFVIALGDRADLRCVDVVDERCAAFLALGMARASGRPVALLCTSGTAPAHWLPAVIEASLTSLPLVLLTADRPPELSHCGAPQTIDQTKLFGDHAVFFADVGTPEAREGALVGLRRTVAQAVATAARGPVHLNLRARKPLEPRDPDDEVGWALRARVDAVLARPLTQPARARTEVDPVAIDDIARRLDRAARPVIVVGPMPARAAEDGTREAVLAIARSTGAPLLAEASSQVRHTRARPRVVAIEAFDLVLRALPPEDEPDLVLQVGSTPTSSALELFLASRPALDRIVIGVDRWIDPHGTARTIAIADPAAALTALARAVGRAPSGLDRAWCDRWIAADRRAWEVVDRELETGGFGEGTIARTLLAALPDRALLTIGNSLPIRTLDRYVRGGAERIVLSQRGANGIDGLVSGAIGASLATGSPSALLLGDLSMQHDVGGLASARLVSAPLAMVVVQNGGGRIFEQLPIAAHAPHAIDRFTTPQAMSMELAAGAFGVPFARATDAASLRAAIDAALARSGASLIEAVVAPHAARDAERRILDAVRRCS